jgi:hypothetical protein
LAIVIVLWAVVCLILPETIALSRRQRIVDALVSARSVRVEEFEEETILAQYELDEMQRASLVREIPAIVPRRGLPISLKLCFVPHHRIIARDSSGLEFTLTICFECDQAQHTGSSIYDMPPPGSAALRQLFKQNGIRIANPDE